MDNIFKYKELIGFFFGSIAYFTVSYLTPRFLYFFGFETNIFDIRFSSIENFMSTLYQVQATIVTLGFAILALLSSVYNEKRYGIKLVEHFMNMPYKLVYLINMELALILVSCISIAHLCYSFTIYFFMSSLFIMFLMCNQVFKIFKDDKIIDNEIRESIVKQSTNIVNGSERNRERILEGLEEEIKFYINKKDTFIIQNRLSLFEEILNKNCTEQILSAYRMNLQNVFLSKNQDIIVSGVKAFISFMKTYNKEVNPGFRISFSGLLCQGFFPSLNWVNYEDVSYIIEELRNCLLKSRNNFVGEYIINEYTSIVYKEVFLKNKLYSSENKVGKIDLYEKTNFRDILIYKQFSALTNYTKSLIDNQEKDVLLETYSKLLSTMEDYISLYKCKTEIIEYIFAIEIYLYYLSEFEDLAKDNGLKEFSRDFLMKNKKNNVFINEFILNYNDEHYGINIDRNKMIFVKKKISQWELMGSEAKAMILDDVVVKFYIYYVLYNSNESNLMSNLKNIINEEDILEICLLYSDDKNLKMEYAEYLNLFIDGYNHLTNKEMVLEKIELFRKELKNLFVEYDTNKSKKVDIKGYIDWFNTDLKKQLTDEWNFLRRVANLEKKKTCTISFQINNIEVNMLSNKNFKTYPLMIARKMFYLEIRKKSEKYFIHESPDISKDTNWNIVIGSAMVLKRIEKELKNFENIKKIKLEYQTNNDIYYLDSDKIDFCIKDVRAELVDMNVHKKISPYKRADGKYDYPVINDIKYLFEEEELCLYLKEKTKAIKIDVDIEYWLKQEFIGKSQKM